MTDIFEKWVWIKRNWLYILEEAEHLDLVFVGGTALNLVLFEEYRASEDIDLYNPNSKGIDNPKGKDEQDLALELSKKLAAKGFEIKSINGRSVYLGPNIKVEIFNDGTAFKKIEKRRTKGTRFSLFDLASYAEMKITALLCRTHYDARDLVDVFVIHKKGNIRLSFPRRECETIEKEFSRRVQEIRQTKKSDLLLFQSKEQLEALPFNEFEIFKRWLVDWLSGFN